MFTSGASGAPSYDGECVLVLCFNRQLGTYLKADLGDTEAEGFVGTFHEFCEKVLAVTGIDQPSTYYDAEHMARFLYVGGSRARVVLHVFRWESRPNASD